MPSDGEQAGFEFTEHTADVGIVARGHDLGELFINAGKALFALMVDLPSVGGGERREIAVEATDREALLVEWLNELLFLFETEQMLFCRFHIVELSDRGLRAVAEGQRLDPKRHAVKLGIKAATYHKLRLEGGPPYKAQVTLDV